MVSVGYGLTICHGLITILKISTKHGSENNMHSLKFSIYVCLWSKSRFYMQYSQPASQPASHPTIQHPGHNNLPASQPVIQPSSIQDTTASSCTGGGGGGGGEEDTTHTHGNISKPPFF
ncbi:hypothetical protein Pmani_034041 [Petrolisthes manimaculis]|uniref:Uncharacterized protein n=1 Tax=Petrolisthes manimaculis TaxID=1843537 RepID=A0AAE1NNA3_9EUCA|nr:hypothetical protein Pmani_034041 [Petrolisthes manimaculis]